MDDQDVRLRRSFRLQLIKNPNHFGHLEKLGLPNLPKPVLQKIGDTSFEELTCVGYNPAAERLAAIVEVKQQSGYLGDACSDGSPEYVRFYLDYGAGWVDVGVASFTAHDLSTDADLCYAVSIDIDPAIRHCCDRDPVLPRVRAILSWNLMPPPNQPAWQPVWGNVLERAIQIAPRSALFCKIFDDDFKLEDVVKLDPGLLAGLKAQLALAEAPPLPPAPLAELVEIARKQDDRTAVMRAAFPQLIRLAKTPEPLALAAAMANLPDGIDLDLFDDFILEPKFDTTYEELHCVGLDRDLETLHGVIQIKRPFGYSGNLCQSGSREYIAFYLDFGAGWEYQGTTFVDVHDIGAVPQGGLWYQASLPVDLDPHKKKWCETGFARIRGVLSWAIPPAPNQPNFIPHWGDREDCTIEVRPLPEGVVPGQTTPVLESIGSMPVPQIDAAGFADGPNIGGTLTADQSPFGGVIRIAGIVAFPPAAGLEYRVMIKGPSDPIHKPFTKSFGVTVVTVIGSSITIAGQTQTPVGDWYPFIPQPAPIFRSVVGNLLAPFTASEDGLHSVYIQVREPGSPVILATSGVHAFFVDDAAPVVDVEITGGNCGKFGLGEVINGTYAMADPHSGSLTLSVTPSAEAAGGHLAITLVIPPGPLPAPLPGPTASNGLSYAAGTMLTVGASGNWELDTTGMQACGYNIRIDAGDRTIVNSGSLGWPSERRRGLLPGMTPLPPCRSAGAGPATTSRRPLGAGAGLPGGQSRA